MTPHKQIAWRAGRRAFAVQRTARTPVRVLIDGKPALSLRRQEARRLARALLEFTTPRDRLAWSATEDARLLEGYRAGRTATAMAARLARPRTEVCRRLLHLGVVHDPADYRFMS